MLYLEKNSQVRIPKLYAAYTKPNPHSKSFGVNYLIMEYIEGEMMTEERFKTFDDEVQELFVSKLAEQFRLLRSIPSEGYYGRVYKQPFHARLPIFRTNHLDPSGPYNSFDEVFQAMYTSVQMRCAEQPRDELHPIEISYIERFYEMVPRAKGTEPVLTLMDCSFDNLIAKPIEDNAGKIVDWKMTFIDIDMFGWLPAFLQVYCAKLFYLYDDETGKTFNRRLAAGISEEDYSTEVDFLLRWTVIATVVSELCRLAYFRANADCCCRSTYVLSC